MIGFHRRYDPNFAFLEKRLRNGEIGDPEIITITCRDPSAPPVSYIERSGGLYRDMMIHDFDMARFLLGDEEPVIGSCAWRRSDRSGNRQGQRYRYRLGPDANGFWQDRRYHQLPPRHLWP